jgi:putative glycosyltransferase (TIGR04348 family)
MDVPKPSIAIVTPALSSANNGNWQTAYRWSGFLRAQYDVSLATEWAPPSDSNKLPACLIALHARRSAMSIARFADTCPDRALVVVLTGTDLYRDIRCDESARLSLDLATHLVVLQEEGLAELAPSHRSKCCVIHQSAPARKPVVPATSHRRTFDVVLVGHMRAEKDPLTAMRALDCLPDDSPVRLIHIGSALAEEYRLAAHALQARSWPTVQRYVWLEALEHAETRRRMGRAQALVISSVMEGGANVIVEAVTAGVPVLASRISGNVGMLGHDYAGYFPPGDYRELARLLDLASKDPVFLSRLREQCAHRASLFAPARERENVSQLVNDALSRRQLAG